MHHLTIQTNLEVLQIDGTLEIGSMVNCPTDTGANPGVPDVVG